MAEKLRVTVWNEFRQEKSREDVRRVYPEGIHEAIASGLAAGDLDIRTACLDMPEQGLAEETLNDTDVLVYWAHCFHGEVTDETAARVRRHCLEGMGLIVLHSGHNSKIFHALLGSSCSLRWRESGERERLWTVAPRHPIARGVPDAVEIPHTEMYGERFDIPDDGKIIFISWYQGGEVFRSGVTFERGNGRIFYFSPGHESFPIYRQPEVLRILGNAVRWAAPVVRRKLECLKAEPPEPLNIQ